MSGGIRGWLIKTLTENFTDEVVRVVTNTIDYVEIKEAANNTVNNEDRNEATDTLNDIMR